jgi:hypothetical protein
MTKGSNNQLVNKGSSKKIKTIVFEDTPLPEHLQRKNDSFRAFERRSAEREKRNVIKDDFSAKKEELEGFMKDIKNFNSNMEIGKSKRKIIEDKLTKLGAPPVKPQKQPLKLKIALGNFRKGRDQKRLEQAKESKVINLQFSQVLKKKKNDKRNKNKK